MTRAMQAMRRRWNALAYDMVNEELARVAIENDRLQAENEELRRQLADAEDRAECWREDAISALNTQAEITGGTVGLTLSGHVLVTH